jgi:hypothetical protein
MTREQLEQWSDGVVRRDTLHHTIIDTKIICAFVLNIIFIGCFFCLRFLGARFYLSAPEIGYDPTRRWKHTCVVSATGRLVFDAKIHHRFRHTIVIYTANCSDDKSG